MGISKKVVLLLFIFILLLGCATVPCPKCPSTTAIVMTPMGLMLIPEGFFDNKDNWITEKEFRDFIMRQREGNINYGLERFSRESNKSCP